MQHHSSVKVWDPFVRVFHWTLVGAFAVAFVTEDDFLTLHTWAGYLVGALVLLRVLWGFTGTRYARFSSFVFSPKVVLGYLKDTLQFRAKRYLGHNPAGGAMIVVLLASLVVTTVTGLVVLGAAENAGPLAGWLGGTSEVWSDIFEEVHEIIAYLTLLLVAIHVGGVIVESVLHRENLVRAMIDGTKRAAPGQ
ncbi:MAG: cytochrome B [Gammaproteobacteria bacterium SG8_47]|nr:MAG: cytochrome B [Gammaproteobacteria bacterium SG8_47]